MILLHKQDFYDGICFIQEVYHVKIILNHLVLKNIYTRVINELTKCDYNARITIGDRMAEKKTVENIPIFKLPHWEQLPDMDLYMDQVVTLLNEYLKPFYTKGQEKMVTSTMINNYVKNGIVHPPIKKRYTKQHVAYLVVVCVLKMVYRMDEISSLIQVQIKKYPVDQAYNYFCLELESCLKCIFMHKKVHHVPSDDEGSLVVDLIRNTVQSVAYTVYVRYALDQHDIN